MKKKILLLIALFSILCLLPIRIKAANVEIKSIEIAEKSNGLTEVNKPTYEKLKVNFDLNFKDVEDYIKYKLTLKNNDETDYEVSDEVKYSDDNHIKYEVSYDGTENIIKSGEEKVVYVTVTYEKAVDFEEFLDGVYEEKNNVIISLAQKEKNPNTLVYGTVTIAVVLLVVSVLVFVYSKRKQKVLMSLILLSAGLIPLITIAIESINIEISATIKIDPPVREAHILINQCNGFDNNIDAGNIGFLDGMTWNDYYENLPADEEPLFSYSEFRENHVFFYGSSLDLCLAAIDEVEEPAENASDEEWEAFYEYLDRIEGCYDNNEFKQTLGDDIYPKTEGDYVVYQCK